MGHRAYLIEFVSRAPIGSKLSVGEDSRRKIVGG
jgi:hypothetical protein